MTDLASLDTPCLLLDADIMARNAAAMRARAAGLGLAFRPHVKTAKCLPVIREMLGGIPPRVTVSTLREAEAVLAAGIRDITYAVGIVPARLDRVESLTAAGALLTLLTDDAGVVDALAARAAARGTRYTLLIELDTGGRRAGLPPDGPALMGLAHRIAAAPGLTLAGVLTHGGHAYRAGGRAELAAIADQEARDASHAADRLRAAGLPCPVVSIGSSPGAGALRDPAGATELRAGVYIFQDLDQVHLGCCGVADIAVSVLASVIGHNRTTGRIVLDAGTLALSKDGGLTASGQEGQGLLCGLDGRPLGLSPITATSQEHGLVPVREAADFDRLPVGSRVRILPNHSCITSAAFDSYRVLRNGRPAETWPRFNGW